MSGKDEIKKILDDHPSYRETLFCRGYLITNRVLNTSEYPFYGQWNTVSPGSVKNLGKLYIYYHAWQQCYVCEKNGLTAALIGHACNPFDMKHREEEILADCMDAYCRGSEAFFEKVSELTGIHLVILNDSERLIAVQDCSGMEACCYGKKEEDIYMSSHPQLVADICGFEMDPFVRKLIGKWFYRFGSNYLPGNITPYRELQNLGPNTFLEYGRSFSVKRFFPLKPHPELEPAEYEGTFNSIMSVLEKNIELCTLKWKRPALSLTGGMDSKTTLACANGLYDRLKFYSFSSKSSEAEDSKAAHSICSGLGLEHIIYKIQDSNLHVKDFFLLKKVIEHNISYIHNLKDNEIRKYIYLYRLNDFDVELKSWISETGRVIRERKYGIKMPKILSPRHFSVLQVRYIFAPAMIRRADRYYAGYLEKVGLDNPLYNYEHVDSHYWEFAWGFWGAAVVSGQNIFRHTVTMPFNNRKLIDMFLCFPHEYRKKDMVHREIIKRANKKVASINIRIENPYMGRRRILFDRLYYSLATMFRRKNS